jgi:CRP-like cAMP-binding protein
MDFSNLFKHETECVNFVAGETILKCGAMSDVMYVVIEGDAEIKLGDKVFYTAHAGSLLGELGLIDHAPVCADVVARTNCRLVMIDKRRFLFLIQQTPNFALDVMKVIAERLRAMNHYALESPTNR